MFKTKFQKIKITKIGFKKIKLSKLSFSSLHFGFNFDWEQNFDNNSSPWTGDADSKPKIIKTKCKQKKKFNFKSNKNKKKEVKNFSLKKLSSLFLIPKK